MSSAFYNGNLGGLAGADLKCQGLADAANLSGTYTAWLSTQTTWASEKLPHLSTPYATIDSNGNKTTIANHWADLASGLHLAPIIYDENGVEVLSVRDVWTGSYVNGGWWVAGGFCQEWGSSDVAESGISGSFTATDSAWTMKYINDGLGGVGMANDKDTCDTENHLYCIEQ